MSRKKLILHFTNKYESSSYELSYLLHQNPFVDKWLRLLTQAIENKTDIRDSGGFYGSGIHDQSELRKTLIEVVTSLNADQPDGLENIPSHFPEIIDQEFLNTLHGHFEKRSVLGDYVHGSHHHMNSTLELLNTSIHQYESTFGRGSNYFTVVANFASDSELFFDEEDYEYFTPHRSYGELYLNYATVGVPVLEAFHRKEKSRPVSQRKYRADFNLHFDPTHKFSKFDELQLWLQTQFNLDASDRQLALGYISLGQIENDGTTMEQLFQNIRKHRVLKKVELFVSRE